ncbi:MAG: efflux RND transporter periplasmic adaptor subunit, partial [Verrucomicrobiota bacterium]|nr:efflux RND transporter periplasmic adaptor subunit [Verrucomicrobiota bacterium]
DETRISTISTRVPGRIDRLFVNYTGIAVNQGEHLAELYSPELLTAQEELLQAIKHNPSLIGSAREKLRLWGFTAEQVAQVEQHGTPSNHMTIHSPVGGIVIHKNAQEGMYVEIGTRIYTIADLSKVWIQLDAYESDLHGLRLGDTATITTEAHPGLETESTIAFISPTIDPATRTTKVRVEVDNPNGLLKPGMFIRATVQATPQIEEPPLLIPASAALQTGKRAVVYVETPNQGKPTYEGREVVLGARLGDFYVVESGLDEGERVVTRGAFKLDAELQIQAKPSMMSVKDETPRPQTLCPVMGGAINKDVFTDYNGMRIYFCCGGCDGAFLEDPEKYLRQMTAENVEPEKVEHAHAH